MLEKEIHYNFQNTCHTLESPNATSNYFKISLKSMQKLELSCTPGLTVLNNAIFLIMLEKEIHYNMQNTAHMLEHPTATSNHFKISLQSFQTLQLCSTAALTVLHNAIFLIMLDKEIEYNLQNTCHNFESPTTTCNDFKISLQLLQKLELSSTACLTVLHNAIFLILFGKRNPLQLPEYISHVGISHCNLQLSQNISPVVAKIRTEALQLVLRCYTMQFFS